MFIKKLTMACECINAKTGELLNMCGTELCHKALAMGGYHNNGIHMNDFNVEEEQQEKEDNED